MGHEAGVEQQLRSCFAAKKNVLVAEQLMKDYGMDLAQPFMLAVAAELLR